MPMEVPPFFMVATRCMVCEDTLAAIEVDSFVRATQDDWERCIAAVRVEAHRLNGLVVSLRDRAKGKKTVLRDFG